MRSLSVLKTIFFTIGLFAVTAVAFAQAQNTADKYIPIVKCTLK
jgi:hypothetical protein